jgi:hypothetical protein
LLIIFLKSFIKLKASERNVVTVNNDKNELAVYVFGFFRLIYNFFAEEGTV